MIDKSQPFHQLAVSHYQRVISQKDKFITSNYIISELVALLYSPLRIPRLQIIAFINSLKQSNHVKIIHINKNIDYLAWELLTKRPDKNWSLVDCSSFIIMEQQKLNQALTNDHHFEQAGFIKLLHFDSS